jgi:hypothetical protein
LLKTSIALLRRTVPQGTWISPNEGRGEAIRSRNFREGPDAIRGQQLSRSPAVRTLVDVDYPR